jgi:5-formyltetrahydrofolate cyclo-ligase
MTKSELRKQALTERNSMDDRLVSRYGEIIANSLINHEWFILSKSVFIYVSMGNEVPTHAIIKNALARGKTVSVPRVEQGTQMCAVPIKNIEQDLKPGKLGILEPKLYFHPVSETCIDLIVVPGLLFDRSGYRIGYGKGYYDRYLNGVERNSPYCRTIGLAFHNQIVQRLPRDSHDKPVMLIITEKQTLVCAAKK